jgi:hypothetical protein
MLEIKEKIYGFEKPEEIKKNNENNNPHGKFPRKENKPEKSDPCACGGYYFKKSSCHVSALSIGARSILVKENAKKSVDTRYTSAHRHQYEK